MIIYISLPLSDQALSPRDVQPFHTISSSNPNDRGAIIIFSRIQTTDKGLPDRRFGTSYLSLGTSHLSPSPKSGPPFERCAAPPGRAPSFSYPETGGALAGSPSPAPWGRGRAFLRRGRGPSGTFRIRFGRARVAKGDKFWAELLGRSGFHGGRPIVRGSGTMR